MTRSLCRAAARRTAETRPPANPGGGFTLLEVMVALGVLAIALLALLALQHQDLQSVIRTQNLTRAATLAQTVMTQAELERFPPLGVTRGNFDSIYPRLYPNFRWQRKVEESGMFPDVRKVEVTVFYGRRSSQSFTLIEFLHNPEPLEAAPPQGALGPQVMPPPPQ
jgi:general secretion pathway protein I